MASFPLLSLWSKRSLIFYFSILNVKLRYKGTNLGFLWNVLEPLFTFLILYIVFTSIRDNRSDFAIYLLTGILLYHIFTRGTISGLTSLRSNQGLIKTLNIGNGFYPLVSIGATTLTAIVEVAVFIAILPALSFVPSWTIVLLPIVVILLLFLIWGLTYMLSIINVYVKDIQPIWGVIIHALFFVSPIFWYMDDAKGILLEIMKINPLGQIIELGHKVVVFGQVPTITDWLYPSAWIVAIFIIGNLIFRKFEKKVAEVL